MNRGKPNQLARCHACGQVQSLARSKQESHSQQEASSRQAPPAHTKCIRCHSHVSLRIPQSIHKTWALLITAAILFIPANLYPVMTVVTFGSGEPATIFSGVIQLIQADMIPIAALVFIASILVPLFKLIGMAFLLTAIQRQWRINQQYATVMYRFIHFIGRWSMLDLFMISILVTLVNMESVARILTGPGATSFGALVVVTMFAAHTFDQRLIWDLLDKDNHK